MGLNKENITLIPAGNSGAKEYWEKLASINWYEIIYDNPSIALKFFIDLKQKIKNEFNPDYLLIDSRTGISEMSGITLSLLADEIVLVAANNKENLNGLKKIITSLNNTDNNINGVVPKISFVLSRVPFTDKAEDKTKEFALINRVKREYLAPFLNEISVIHSDRELEENEVIKIAYNKEEAVSQIAKDYLNLFERITKDDLSEADIKKFNDIKSSEKLFGKALSADFVTQKMDFLSQAISLNANNALFYIYRALMYESIKEYNSAIDDCMKALSLEERNLQASHILVTLYIDLRDYSKANELTLKLLQNDQNDLNALHFLGVIFTRTKNFVKAIEVYNRVIQLDPYHALAYNGSANAKRLNGDLDGALKDVYKALEVNSNLTIAHGTLAEIHAELGNANEFYINFENALKLNAKEMEQVMAYENVYLKFIDDERFKKLIEKYKITYSFIENL